MTFNIGELTTINAAQVDTSADRFLLWDNSEAGAARTKAITPQQARLLVQNVDTQRGSTKPTQRSDGTSLQSGDRWFDTSENRWFFWNGTYWLTEEILFLQTTISSALSASLFPGGDPIDPNGNDLFFTNFRASILFAGTTLDGSNFWTVGAKRANSANATTLFSSLVFNTPPATTRVFAQNSLSLHMDVSALDVQMVYIDFVRTGSPSNISIVSSARFSYRLAKP